MKHFEENRRFATFQQRALAHNIDLLCTLPMYYLNSVFIENNVWLIITCLFQHIIYHCVFESYMTGKTPGKRIVKIKVTSESEINLVLRNIYKILSIALFFLGYTISLFTKKRQTLHDMLAGCFVVEDLST